MIDWNDPRWAVRWLDNHRFKLHDRYDITHACDDVASIAALKALAQEAYELGRVVGRDEVREAAGWWCCSQCGTDGFGFHACEPVPG